MSNYQKITDQILVHLKSEPKAIFKAASLAEKAVQYIESLQSNEQQQAA